MLMRGGRWTGASVMSKATMDGEADAELKLERMEVGYEA
jgi:ribulose 1,5-bisphosphate synthetase/thiazole synthase